MTPLTTKVELEKIDFKKEEKEEGGGEEEQESEPAVGFFFFATSPSVNCTPQVVFQDP